MHRSFWNPAMTRVVIVRDRLAGNACNDSILMQKRDDVNHMNLTSMKYPRDIEDR